MRRYEQYCAVARALDLVGERWTLLVVRSLLAGPRRYRDLREDLPGIATDLLTARLRALESAGYVERRLDGGATVYEMSDDGTRLVGPVVLALARVGLAELGAPTPDEVVNVDALVLLLRASYRGGGGEAPLSYQLELDGEPYAVEVGGGVAWTRRGVTADAPACTLRTDARTLAEILGGEQGAAATALADGRVEVEGSGAAAREFLAGFAYGDR
jgi:DNA-binding HxlR family transcriptional regulator